jgi:hypothetical protein
LKRVLTLAFVGAFEEISDWNFREQLEVNFFGTANIIRTVLPGMRKRRSGHIINITGLSMALEFMGLNCSGTDWNTKFEFVIGCASCCGGIFRGVSLFYDNVDVGFGL